MNKIKQWDAQLDAWAEQRWPGIINKLVTFNWRLAGVVVGVAIAYLIILCATKGAP
jgi:hypothetical protein